MKNILLAALTTGLLTAASYTSFAGTKSAKTEMAAEKVNFTESILKEMDASANESATIQVDYIVDENGKPFITFIDPVSETTRMDVIRTIERSVFQTEPVLGKVYSLELNLKNNQVAL